MKITKSAKTYAKKIYIDLKADLLYGDELREFIVASIKYDKDNSFHNENYYDMVEEAVYNLYDVHNRYCSCCKKYKYKGYFRQTKNFELNVCKECASKIEVRSRVDNIKKFYDKFEDRFELITDKNKFNLLQVHTVKVKCKKCGTEYSIILNRLLHRLDIDFCRCNSLNKKEE